jgi:hypothetical protein
MDKITLTNLTSHQVEMLDAMWTIDSAEEYLEWYELLDAEDQETADDLQRLVIMEVIEREQFKQLEECNQARDYLKRFML